MKTLYRFLPALVFLIFLAVMALLLLFSPVKEYSENEKRYLAGYPEVTSANVLSGETQKQLEKFTADQIPGRDFFVGINAYWNLAHRAQRRPGHLLLRRGLPHQRPQKAG